MNPPRRPDDEAPRPGDSIEEPPRRTPASAADSGRPPKAGDAARKTRRMPEEAPRRRGPSGGFYVECFLREVMINIRRNPMMSIASVSTVMVLAMILGFFVVVVMNLDALSQDLAGEMQVKAYMKASFRREDVGSFHASVLKVGHVEGVHFVSKETAFKRLKERLGTKITLDDLSGNPLPDAFEVRVDDPKFLEAVAAKVRKLPGVETVDFGRDVARKLMALNQVVRVVGLVILAMLFASTLLIVSNTIRLTVFARRKEIDIMQLVGAADWFIRWPFILEGVAQGLVGAGLAATIVDISYRLVVPQLHRTVPFLPILAPAEVLPVLNLGLVALGCAVGALGSLISVNRHLNA